MKGNGPFPSRLLPGKIGPNGTKVTNGTAKSYASPSSLAAIRHSTGE